MRELAAEKREVSELKRQKVAARKALTEEGLARLKPEVEARVRAVLQAQLDRDARLKDAALERARAAEKRQSSAAALAATRLKRKREAEARASSLEVEKDELAEELGALRAEHAKLVARQGPDLGGGRKRGRFAAAPYQLRALIWGQLARRTPPSAVGPNVADAARLLAPGAPVREPHPAQIRADARRDGLGRPGPGGLSVRQLQARALRLASTRPPSCRRGCSAPTSSARWRTAPCATSCCRAS